MWGNLSERECGVICVRRECGVICVRRECGVIYLGGEYRGSLSERGVSG